MKSVSAIVTCMHLLVVVVQVSGHNVTGGNDTAVYGGRILNGGKARPSDFFYVVRLQIEREICGGTIVSDYYIMTAAHCIHGKNCKAIGISPSSWVVGDEAKFHADACITHENYPAENPYDYDIGVIRTEENLVIDGRLAVARLPPAHSTVPDGTPALIAGWGTEEDDYSADFLKRGEVSVQKWDDCKHAYSVCDTCPGRIIPKATMCVIGHGEKPAGACLGDSGGPVMINGVVRGIIICVITSKEKCVIGTPALSTSVAEFITWIMDHS